MYRWKTVTGKQTNKYEAALMHGHLVTRVTNEFITQDSEWLQLRGLAILALRGALKVFH